MVLFYSFQTHIQYSKVKIFPNLDLVVQTSHDLPYQSLKNLWFPDYRLALPQQVLLYQPFAVDNDCREILKVHLFQC